MELNELLANDWISLIASFLLGGACGSLLTISIRSNKNKVTQKNISTTSGDIVGRDKSSASK